MANGTSRILGAWGVRGGAALAAAWLLVSCGRANPSQLSQLETAPKAADRGKEFVTRVGRDLKVGRDPFYFSGTNQYYFFYKNHAMVDDVLQSAHAMGLNVIRTWAFCEGSPHDGFCFQPRPREYDEASFRNLDYVIKRASEFGIRVVLTLANNWGGFDNFGGVDQYLAWAGLAGKGHRAELTSGRSCPSGGRCSLLANHDDFFRGEGARSLYRDYVRHVVSRVNSLTGIPYKDDPTIMMWELMNEPRTEDQRALSAWIDEMAGFIKSLDSHHLVSTGSEGGYATDFIATHASPHIDVASMHLYPESWGISVAAADAMLENHMRMAANDLGKPIFVGEFGLRDQAQRAAVYRRWYELMNRGGMNGSLFWLLSGYQYGATEGRGERYPDYDGFTIYFPDTRGAVQVIEEQARATEERQKRPQLLLLGPSSSALLKGTVTLRLLASGSRPLSKVEYQIDAGAWQVLPLPHDGAELTLDLDTRLLADGVRQLRLRATDQAALQTTIETTMHVKNAPGLATRVSKTPPGGEGPEFGELYATDDAERVYFLLQRFDAPRPFASDNFLYLDLDGDSSTGEHGFDHRLNIRSLGDHPQGYGDVVEWYYWNQTYWAYGGYWQGGDRPSVIKANRRRETLPSGAIAAAPGGMLEIAFPKKPASGIGASSRPLRFFFAGAHGQQLGSSEQPISHPMSDRQTVVVDGAITSPEEWDYAPTNR